MKEMPQDLEEEIVETKPPVVLNFAPVWKRILAYIVDELILFLILSFMFYFAYFNEIFYLYQQPNFDKLLYDFALRNQIKFNTVGFVLQIAYYSLLWAGTGQTFGAKLFGIAVIHIERGKISVFQGIARAALLWSFGFIFFIPLLFVVNPVYKQRIHDFLTFSVVIELPKKEKADEG
jgi:uncharacterized RDD family membrane protein YckC